jgi:hypothetical protein
MIDSNHHTRYYKCVPCVQKALSNPPADVDFEDVGASVVETGFVGGGGTEKATKPVSTTEAPAASKSTSALVSESIIDLMANVGKIEKSTISKSSRASYVNILANFIAFLFTSQEEFRKFISTETLASLVEASIDRGNHILLLKNYYMSL